jgi:ankyrin repeat protein
MGLRYYDDTQYLDAVKRNDALAVELYLIGRGINASAKGSDGRTALDIARANKNDRLVGLLSRNLP